MASKRPGRTTAAPERSAWSLARAAPRTERVTPTELVLAQLEAGPRFEVAWDGLPVIAARCGDEARLFSLDHREWTAPAQNVALTLRALDVDPCVLEGTLCVLDDAGRPSFDALKARVARGTGAAPVLMVSQVLQWGSERPATGDARHAALSRLPATQALIASSALEGVLSQVLATVRDLGLPGVIAWPRDDTRRALVVSASPTPLPLSRSLSKPPVITNPDKVLFPRDGVTKRDVVAWYQAVEPVLLPHLRDRPVVCQRWPDGIDDFTWFQHRPPPRAPDYLESIAIDDDRRLLVNSADGLVWMANQAALTFHTWATRARSLTSPDWAIIDLDPGPSTTWPQVIDVAVAIRSLLELLEVPSVVKTSGQKGLHVLVPLAPKQTLDAAFRFAQRVCAMVAELKPDCVSLTHDEKTRRGRLFLDHLQNFRGKTLVAPYSLRAVDGAPVSTPLRWEEVTPALDPKAFTRAVVLRRLEQHGDLFERVLRDGVDLAPVLARLG